MSDPLRPVRLTCVLLSASLLLSACRTTRQAAAVEYLGRVEYRTIVDTVLMRDSVHVMERQAGDTVYLTQYRYVLRDRLRLDTVYVERTDSVPYPVERVEYVERDLNDAQKALMTVGLLSLAAAAAWLIRKFS